MDIRELILQALKEHNIKDIDLRPGTGIYEFIVKGAELIYSTYKALIESAVEKTYLSNYESLDEATMDLLVSNYLIKRKVGIKVSGYVRIYFADAQDVNITPVVYFRTSDGRRYFPVYYRTYYRSEMLQNYDSSLGLYFLDILVQAESPGTEYNVNVGEIIQAMNLDNYVAVTNLNQLFTTEAHETNAQLYDRTLKSLTLRGLVNANAIITTLFEQFPSIEHISVIGYGDPEMWRDIVNGVHTGGKADIYIWQQLQMNTDTNLPFADIDLIDPNGRRFPVAYTDISGIDLIPPIVINDDINSYIGGRTSGFGEGLYGEGMYGLVTPDENGNFLFVEPVEDLSLDPPIRAEYIGSSLQKLRIYVPDTINRTQNSLAGSKMSNEDINVYLRDPSNRIVTVDLLGKHFWIGYVRVHVKVLRGDKSLVRQAIIDYLKSLKTASPEIGDMIAYVENKVNGVILEHPIKDFTFYVWDDQYILHVYRFPEQPLKFIGVRNIFYLPATEDPVLGENGVVVE